MKKVLSILFLLLVAFPSFVYAEEGNEKSCRELMDADRLAQIKEFKDEDATIQESYTIDIFEGLWNIAGINSIDSLIFGNPFCLWVGSDVSMVYGIFPSEYQTSIVDPIFKFFTSLFVLALVLAMMIFSLKKMMSPINKNDFVNEFLFYVTTGFLIVVYYWASDYIFLLNEAIVNTFRNLLLNQGINIRGVDIFASQDDFNFTDIIVIFAEWILMLFLNAIYGMRVMLVTILLGLGGLAIISLLFQETRHIFALWLQDLLGAIFMQSIHAFYLTIILLLFSTVSGELAIVLKMISLILFIPLSTWLQNLLRLSSGGVLTSIGMNGVNTIATTVATARSFNSKKINTPKMGQLAETKISALGKGANSTMWTKATSFASKAGVVTGVAAGSVLGPGGAILAGTAGSKLFSSTLQVPRNVAAGLKGSYDTVKDARKNGFSNVMSNIQQKQLFFGNMGESMGTMVGRGEVGRKMGNFASGITNERILNSSELGGLRGITIQQMASRFPEADFIFKQTNEGSGFYLTQNQQDTLISPIGAADPNLSNGETRCIDYKGGRANMEYDPVNQKYPLNESSSQLSRLSEAYIKTNTGERYMDTSFDAKRMNPDEYFQSSNQNNNVTKPENSRHPGFV